jgi:hypothetical protein
VHTGIKNDALNADLPDQADPSMWREGALMLTQNKASVVAADSPSRPYERSA